MILKIRNRSIKTKFAAVYVALTLLLGLTIVLFIKTSLQQTLTAELHARSLILTKEFARELVTPILTEDIVLLQSLVFDHKKAVEDTEYIFVTDSRGTLLAHTFGETFPVGLKEANACGSSSAARLVELETEQGRIFDISVPVLHSEAGCLRVGISGASVNSSVSIIVWTIIAILSIITLSGAVISIAFASVVTKPLVSFSEVAEKIGQGDLNAEIAGISDEKDNKDEIVSLKRDFQLMVNNLRAITVSKELLDKSEQKLRDVTASLGEGVYMIGKNGCLTFMNPEAERLLGWTEQELLGRQMHDIIHHHKQDGRPLPALECPIIRVTDSREVCRVEEDYFFHKDGAMIPVTYIAAPVMEAGKVIASVTAFRDITTRLRMEENLRKHIEELERFNRLSVGRELRMVELKQEVNSLLLAAGCKEKYRVAEEKESGK
jgi:PAS domain S-box-containing protein